MLCDEESRSGFVDLKQILNSRSDSRLKTLQKAMQQKMAAGEMRLLKNSLFKKESLEILHVSESIMMTIYRVNISLLLRGSWSRHMTLMAVFLMGE